MLKNSSPTSRGICICISVACFHLLSCLLQLATCNLASTSSLVTQLRRQHKQILYIFSFFFIVVFMKPRQIAKKNTLPQQQRQQQVLGKSRRPAGERGGGEVGEGGWKHLFWWHSRREKMLNKCLWIINWKLWNELEKCMRRSCENWSYFSLSPPFYLILSPSLRLLKVKITCKTFTFCGEWLIVLEVVVVVALTVMRIDDVPEKYGKTGIETIRLKLYNCSNCAQWDRR